MQNAYIRMVLDVRERNTPNVVVVKKNDTARTLRIHLVDGNAAYTVGPECTVVMTALKADGTKLFNSCTVEENVVVYPFTEQTCSCAGRMICEVRVIGSNGKMLTSASFTMVVQETAYSDGDTVSQGEADALSKLVAEAKTGIAEVNNAVSGANAAAGKANAAAESADQAAENANTAAVDVGAATQKANEAARLATEAAGQVGEAVRSANEAAQAANTAVGRVERAIAGANWAAEAAGSAAAEADQAAQRANQAASHAGTSAQEASAAAQAAGNAAQEAAQAAGKATEAGRDAATAATRANDAAEELQRRVEAGDFDGKTPVKGVDYWTEAEVQAAEDAVYQRVDGKLSPVVEQAKTAADQAADTANEAKKAAGTADKKVEALREVVSKFHNNIVETARGKSIVLDDASGSGLEGLRVFGRTGQETTTGKNLLKNIAETTTVNGIEATVNKDGSVEINGTATSQAVILMARRIPYASSVGKRVSGCTGGSFQTYSIVVSYYTDSDKWIKETYCTNGDHVIPEVSNCDNIEFSILVRSGVHVNKKVLYPMLRDASISDPTYEPYTGGIPSPNPDYPQPLVSPGDDGNIAVSVTGNNLLRLDIESSQSVSGITFLVNSDKSITINGTATSPIYLNIAKCELYTGVRYILTGSTGGSPLKYALYLNNPNFTGENFNYDVPAEFEMTASGKFTVSMFVAAGASLHNITMLPMVRESSVSDSTYEPYNGGSITTPTPNGLPGIKVSSGGNYTDSTGQQWVCDEVDLERGVYVKRIGNTMGKSFTKTNVIQGSAGERYFIAVNDRISYQHSNALCSHYPYMKKTSYSFEGDYLATDEGGRIHIRCKNKLFGSEEAFNKWVIEVGMVVYYLLETPVETPLSPELIAAYITLHTNYPNTNILNDEGAEMEVRYIADTKLYIDKKFDQLAKAMLGR